MPNVNNINTVIAAISAAGKNPHQPGVGFSMEFHYHSPIRVSDTSGFRCKTVACICGWTNLVSGHHSASDDDHAAEFLGIGYEQGQRLFYPDWAGREDPTVHPYTATPEQAIAVLEILRDTGDIDWISAMKNKVVEPA